MAINVSFNGATIYKPGAYSKVNIDLSGGFPLGTVGLIAIFGESTRGRPGSSEPNIAANVFTANQISEVRNKYGSGPIVDAMNFLFSPASDGAVPSGAQAVYIYKTNASTSASLALANSYAMVDSLEYGIGGNTITYKAEEIAEVAPSISATFDEGEVGSGSISIMINGESAGSVAVDGPYASKAALASDVAAWSVSGLSFSVSGSDGASTLTITMSADALANRKGFGKSMELSGSVLSSMNIDEGLVASSVESAMVVTIKQTRDLLTEQDTVGGNVVLLGAYTGSQAAATVEVNSSSVVLTAGSSVQTFDKSAYSTLLQLVSAMSLIPDWSFSLSSSLYNSLPVSVLDEVTVGAKSSSSDSKPARIKKDAHEVSSMLSQSSLVSISEQSSVGLMDACSEVALSGGSLGGTSTAEITSALEKFKEIRVNAVVPLFSRNASDDIIDNVTDGTSNYTILGIHQAVKTHCALMATTKNRSERQGYLSLKDTLSNSLNRSALLADARLQLCIQDTRNINAQGEIKWFQPWAQSCLVAGARAGSPVGTPLTFKYFNVTGIRHSSQSMNTAEEDIVIDFNPNSQFEKGIQGGVTFFEAPQSGGIRCVVDNTTYAKDSNWVYNRANVVYAADVVAFDFRNQLENIYVGQKNNVKANEVKSVASTILGTFLAQGITVATADAPNGFKQLTVNLKGNIIEIGVTIVLVEGIDFILNDITITRVQSQA